VHPTHDMTGPLAELTISNHSIESRSSDETTTNNLAGDAADEPEHDVLTYADRACG